MRLIENIQNLETTKGDTIAFGVEIYNLGQALDAAKFTVKNFADDPTPIFQKTIGSGIEIDHVEGNDYFYKVRVNPTDTENLEPRKYYYDLEIEVNGDKFTILKGILTIEADITNGGV